MSDIKGTAILHILIADDLKFNQKAVGDLLKPLGHDVETVANGKQALQAVLGGDFDLVFLDSKMPGMNGPEVSREIRKREVELGYRVALVGMVTPNQPEEDKSCLAAGMDALLHKPIRVRNFAPVMSRVMDLLEPEEDPWSGDVDEEGVSAYMPRPVSRTVTPTPVLEDETLVEPTTQAELPPEVDQLMEDLFAEVDGTNIAEADDSAPQVPPKQPPPAIDGNEPSSMTPPEVTPVTRKTEVLEPILDPVPPPSKVVHPPEIDVEAEEFIRSLLANEMVAADEPRDESQDEPEPGTADAPVPEAVPFKPEIVMRRTAGALERLLNEGMEILEDDGFDAPVTAVEKPRVRGIPVTPARAPVRPAQSAPLAMPELPAFDAAAALARQGGDAARVTSRSQEFVLQAMADLRSLQEALDDGDLEAVRQILMTLRSGARSLGARQFDGTLGLALDAMAHGDKIALGRSIGLLEEAVQIFFESLADLVA